MKHVTGHICNILAFKYNAMIFYGRTQVLFHINLMVR